MKETNGHRVTVYDTREQREFKAEVWEDGRVELFDNHGRDPFVRPPRGDWRSGVRAALAGRARRFELRHAEPIWRRER